MMEDLSWDGVVQMMQRRERERLGEVLGLMRDSAVEEEDFARASVLYDVIEMLEKEDR